MFDVTKEISISEKDFTEANYKRLHIKQVTRLWWWYVFNSWLFDRNK